MKELIFKTVEDGNIEDCRELCNSLMNFQKSKSFIHPECFDNMNFETRMKKSYESALRKHVVIVYDKEKPIAYIYSSIDIIDENVKKGIPAWAPPEAKTSLGFYPEDFAVPQNVGCLNNLYIIDDYRKFGIGRNLVLMSLEWFKSFSDVEYIFVYISNGNDDAIKFYENNGFIYSHEVYNGFIKAFCNKIK